jgi:hypothetical protein
MGAGVEEVFWNVGNKKYRERELAVCGGGEIVKSHLARARGGWTATVNQRPGMPSENRR